MGEGRFVSRGGLKLAAALEAFALNVAGRVCVDLGCNVGGFTDCLLQRGAAKVYAVDTGYGELAWKLRNDARVVVIERTNAMHLPPEVVPAKGVDLVVIDLGWTPQRHAIPAALRWGPRKIITLIKPHYEATADQKRGKRGIMDDDEAQRIAHRVIDDLPALGVKAISHIRSPILGGKGKGKRGNVEYLALLERRA